MLELARSVAFGHEGYTTTRGDRSSRAFDAVPGEKVVVEEGERGSAGRRAAAMAAAVTATAGGAPACVRRASSRRGEVRGESRGEGESAAGWVWWGTRAGLAAAVE